MPVPVLVSVALTIIRPAADAAGTVYMVVYDSVTVKEGEVASVDLELVSPDDENLAERISPGKVAELPSGDTLVC